MTSEEFSQQQDQALTDFHPELAKVIRMIAFEQGHSSGYEEVLNYVRSYAFEFQTVNELLQGGTSDTKSSPSA